MKISIIYCLAFLFLAVINSSAKEKEADIRRFKNQESHWFIMLNDTITPQKEDRVFLAVDQNPEFPGGINAMDRFIKDRILYTKEARENKIEGRVLVQTIIEKNEKIDILYTISDNHR